MNYKNIIDFTNLKPQATEADIKNLCELAIKNDYATVCVNPNYIYRARVFLARSNVEVCTVIGFPLGAHNLEVKQKEASLAYESGAHEFDLVPDFSSFLNGKYDLFVNEISMIKKSINNKKLKVILEAEMFDPLALTQVATLAIAGGADFLKTSTGTMTSEWVHKLQSIKTLLEITKGTKVKVKASGGIRSVDQVKHLAEMGVHRIGTSTEV